MEIVMGVIVVWMLLSSVATLVAHFWLFKGRSNIEVKFVWYDLWIGVYFTRKHSIIVGVLPAVMIELDWTGLQTFARFNRSG